MLASEPRLGHDNLAQQLFSIMTRFSLSLPRSRRHAGDLKDIEFLSLTILQTQGTMIVGDIQRLLGILPAQMSRIIRSLENRDRPLVNCRINPQDKRKVDVGLTVAGEQALHHYQEVRIRKMTDLLQQLSDDDLETLHSLLERISFLHDQNG